MVRLRLAGKLIPLWISFCGGCAHVASYERSVVARPGMTTADLTGQAQRHATEVHEGAMRSGTTVEAGCGCN
jgi:hypothetical protein